MADEAEWSSGGNTSSDEDVSSDEEVVEDTNNDGKGLICEFPGCGKVFKKPSILLQHSMVHSKKKPYECGQCGKRFGRPYHLKRHTLSVHSEKTLFPCTVEGCNFVSNLKHNLTKHVKRAHEVELPFKCSFEGCDKAFKKRKSLFLHEPCHQQGKPFKCLHEGCGKSYEQPSKLKLHSLIHKKEKAYFCKNDNCDAMFFTWTDLRKHIYECSVYPCPDCGKIFKAQYKLKRHKAVHLENRVMFKCPVEGCKKEYTEQRNVVAHVKTHHTNENLFKCPDERCGQTFVYKGSLTKHIKNHEKILKTYKRIAKNKKKKERKRRKQKRIHLSETSKVSGFVHELSNFVTESDLERGKNSEEQELGGLTTTEDESELSDFEKVKEESKGYLKPDEAVFQMEESFINSMPVALSDKDSRSS